VIAGDSFEMDAVGALRLSPLRRGLAIDSTVDIFTFYVPHRHVYGEQWIKFMKDGVNATPLPTVNTTGYIDHAAFLGTINPDTNKIPKHLFQRYLNIYNNYLKAPWMPDRTEANPNELNQDDARYALRYSLPIFTGLAGFENVAKHSFGVQYATALREPAQRRAAARFRPSLPDHESVV